MKKKSFAQRVTNGNLKNRSTYLREIATRAFENGHYLESAIINFQTVEFCLRLVIHLLAVRAGISESPMKRLEDEQSFFRLVLYFDLLKPGNILSQRLIKFNNDRNDFMHKLYYSESVKSLETDLRKFCSEGGDLIHRLLVDIGLREDD
jgi:hypothetical protein